MCAWLPNNPLALCCGRDAHALGAEMQADKIFADCCDFEGADLVQFNYASSRAGGRGAKLRERYVFYWRSSNTLCVVIFGKYAGVDGKALRHTSHA